MFARFPLQASEPRHSDFGRLAEWWPAAIVGLLALLGAAPDSHAGTILKLL